MRYSNSSGAYGLNHDDVISLLPGIPGREMVKSICLGLWHDKNGYGGPGSLYFSSHAEFFLGRCGDVEEPGRIDTILEIRTEDMLKKDISGPVFGIEIKTSPNDLLSKRDNLTTKYINSGQCNYYFLVASEDILAMQACIKYMEDPRIGVASLSSGKLLKLPISMDISDEGIERYRRQLVERSAASPECSYHKYYERDREWIEVKMKDFLQDGKVIRT